MCLSFSTTSPTDLNKVTHVLNVKYILKHLAELGLISLSEHYIHSQKSLHLYEVLPIFIQNKRVEFYQEVIPQTIEKKKNGDCVNTEYP